jgi:hypothetical protein
METKMQITIKLKKIKSSTSIRFIKFSSDLRKKLNLKRKFNVYFSKLTFEGQA